MHLEAQLIIRRRPQGRAALYCHLVESVFTNGSILYGEPQEVLTKVEEEAKRQKNLPEYEIEVALHWVLSHYRFYPAVYVTNFNNSWVVTIQQYVRCFTADCADGKEKISFLFPINYLQNLLRVKLAFPRRKFEDAIFAFSIDTMAALVANPNMWHYQMEGPEIVSF